MSVGTTEVCNNPSEESPPPKVSTLSISTEDLSLRDGQQVIRLEKLTTRDERP